MEKGKLISPYNSKGHQNVMVDDNFQNMKDMSRNKERKVTNHRVENIYLFFYVGEGAICSRGWQNPELGRESSPLLLHRCHGDVCREHLGLRLLTLCCLCFHNSLKFRHCISRNMIHFSGYLQLKKKKKNPFTSHTSSKKLIANIYHALPCKLTL